MGRTLSETNADLAIIGAGAAGLMTAIAAAPRLRDARVLLLDGAKRVGVKILVAGGGRCNVTHHAVDEQQYAGGSRNTIRNVLRRFSADDTVAFFSELGVELKREKTGKLFPTTDDAHTVLDALLLEVDRLGVVLWHPWRVAAIARCSNGFEIIRDTGEAMSARRVVVCTGGKALPRSGSDGGGYTLVQSLGHTLTDRVFPSLVPLRTSPGSSWITELSGLSCRAAVEVRASTGKKLARFENDLLCTHFGLSGPAPMDASRWLTAARLADADASLHVAWLPNASFEEADAQLRELGKKQVATWLRERLPERLAHALCTQTGIDPVTPGTGLAKDDRRALAHTLTGMKIDIAGDRGFTHAETTAGGVPLTEIDPKTMKSRACDGLFLAGEILDVDGRIGGFNFQWAWATGHIAGIAAAESLGKLAE
ncbi:MAG: NAD(P)/FAD-dependent oxidoreductase [Planctomycetota bacterium]